MNFDEVRVKMREEMAVRSGNGEPFLRMGEESIRPKTPPREARLDG